MVKQSVNLPYYNKSWYKYENMLKLTASISIAANAI